MLEGVGFAGEAPIAGWQWRHAHPGLCPSLTEILMGGAHPSEEGRNLAAYRFGR
jgi:hypothetical protein